MINNRSAKKYLRHVRSMLPGSLRMKKQIMVQITNELNLYLEEQPGVDYNGLLCRFGEPEIIAASYIEAMGTADILKKLRIRKWIISTIAAVLALVVLVWGTMVTYETRQHKSCNDGYVVTGIE